MKQEYKPIASTFPSSVSNGTGFPVASINLHSPSTPMF